jgi:hypothetical protein
MHLWDSIEHPIDQIVGIDDEEGFHSFLFIEFEIFLYRESLILEHLSEKSSLEDSWQEMHMKMFYTPITESLSRTRKIMIIPIEFLSKREDIRKLEDLYLRELMRVHLMRIWNCHDMLIITRVGIYIMEYIPVFPFPDDMSFIFLYLTERAIL